MKIKVLGGVVTVICIFSMAQTAKAGIDLAKVSTDCDMVYSLGGRDFSQPVTTIGQLHEFPNLKSKLKTCLMHAQDAACNPNKVVEKAYWNQYVVEPLKKLVPASEEVCTKGVKVGWRAYISTTPDGQAGTGTCILKIDCKKKCEFFY